jgi:hypothetical protein
MASSSSAHPAGTEDVRALKRELRAAARVLTERGLNVSARWCVEKQRQRQQFARERNTTALTPPPTFPTVPHPQGP